MDFHKIYNQIKEIELREGASININADNADEIAHLMQMFSNAGVAPPPEMSMPPEPEGDCGCGGDEPKGPPPPMPGSSLPAMVKKIEAEEDYDNEPDEKYSDNSYMQQDLAGGINKPKKMHKPSADGDNPMAVEAYQSDLVKDILRKFPQQYKVFKAGGDLDGDLEMALTDVFSDEMPYGDQTGDEGTPDEWIADKLDSMGLMDSIDNDRGRFESIKNDLYAALAEKKSKPDFLDVDKDGDKKEPMKKALKDKGKDKKTDETLAGTGKGSHPEDQLKGKQKVGKSAPSTGGEQKNVTRGKLVGEQSEVDDIIALATKSVGNSAVANKTGDMMDLKKLAGL